MFVDLTSVYCTQRVDPFIDDQLSVSQVVQDGFKVVRAAIYQERSL